MCFFSSLFFQTRLFFSAAVGITMEGSWFLHPATDGRQLSAITELQERRQTADETLLLCFTGLLERCMKTTVTCIVTLFSTDTAGC